MNSMSENGFQNRVPMACTVESQLIQLGRHFGCSKKTISHRMSSSNSIYLFYLLFLVCACVSKYGIIDDLPLLCFAFIHIFS